MFKKFVVLIVVFFFGILSVYAQRGCCSHHGGVAGCSPYGRQVCRDGTLSPSCGCTPPRVYGCTDSTADNYNSSANTNDGSCIYKGCTDVNAKNYNSKSNTPDGSCLYEREIIETGDIPFEIEKEEDCTVSENQITREGVLGKKEIIYLVVQNEQGVEISKLKKSEHTITEPISQIMKVPSENCDIVEEQEGVNFIIVFILGGLFLFNFIASRKITNKNLIIHEIQGAHKGFYIVYFLFVIPMIIDFIFILNSKFKK